MAGLFRRPPHPQQRVRYRAAIEGAPSATNVDAGLASGTGAASDATVAIATSAAAAPVPPAEPEPVAMAAVTSEAAPVPEACPAAATTLVTAVAS